MATSAIFETVAALIYAYVEQEHTPDFQILREARVGRRSMACSVRDRAGIRREDEEMQDPLLRERVLVVEPLARNSESWQFAPDTTSKIHSDLRFTMHEPFGFKDWNDQLRAKPHPLLPYRPAVPSVA